MHTRVWFTRLLRCGLGATLLATSAFAQTWFDQGNPTPAALEVVDWLQHADEHGLLPMDYAAQPLAAAVLQAWVKPLPLEQAQKWEEVLDLAVRQFLTDLHDGRVDPAHLGYRYRSGAKPRFDAEAVLKEALAADRPRLALEAATPAVPLYGHLHQAMVHYRAMRHEAWGRSLAPLPRTAKGGAGKLEVGTRYLDVAMLWDRLQQLGDASASAVPAGGVYTAELADAVRHFQQRHGLTVDGILGPATLAQIEVPPQARVRQLELTMERLRWTPLIQGRRLVVVNLPEFVLRGYAVQGGHVEVQTEMNVVVGRALDTRTPVFDEDMRTIEFSPYWNVPSSIARGELVPKLRRDPRYFAREGFEFVLSGGRIDTQLSQRRLDDVMAGRARLRQRPGPLNALGDIKFVFPNRDNIYLHHTPATALFERDRRDFSHGCIRVADPVGLARFVLQGMPGWDETRIRQAMASGESNSLQLADPVPVLITYGTSLVKRGQVYFYNDIYGHDRVLDAALRARRHPVSVPPEIR
jgi:murein L,D-transpeptidase YcbB/YkuD